MFIAAAVGILPRETGASNKNMRSIGGSMPLTLAPRFFLVCALIGVGAACAQSFPSKPLRIVCGEAGGGTDFAARVIAPALAASVGQAVIVDNRGGSGNISGEIVAKAPPDGHTMLFNGAAFWLLPFMNDKTPFDPLRDFASVILAVTQPTMLVVYPSFQAGSVKELIALAKTRPGSLNYASGPAGSSSHLAAELFKAMAGVNVVRVVYKGTGPGI